MDLDELLSRLNGAVGYEWVRVDELEDRVGVRLGLEELNMLYGSELFDVIYSVLEYTIE
jgi:hypothetical protein